MRCQAHPHRSGPSQGSAHGQEDTATKTLSSPACVAHRPRQPCVHTDSVGQWVRLVSFGFVREGGGRERERAGSTGRSHTVRRGCPLGGQSWHTRLRASEARAFPRGRGVQSPLSGSARHGSFRSRELRWMRTVVCTASREAPGRPVPWGTTRPLVCTPTQEA